MIRINANACPALDILRASSHFSGPFQNSARGEILPEGHSAAIKQMSGKPHQWDRKGDVMFTRTLSGEIADEDWYKFLDELKNGIRVVFAVSHGDVAPSATQRRDAAKILSDHKITAIVLTDSRVSRGILTAMSWFGANVVAFPWSELQRATEAASDSPDVRQQLVTSATNFRKSVK